MNTCFLLQHFTGLPEEWCSCCDGWRCRQSKGVWTALVESPVPSVASSERMVSGRKGSGWYQCSETPEVASALLIGLHFGQMHVDVPFLGRSCACAWINYSLFFFHSLYCGEQGREKRPLRWWSSQTYTSLACQNYRSYKRKRGILKWKNNQGEEENTFPFFFFSFSFFHSSFKSDRCCD